MNNTRIHYMYRDASNYKRGKTIVVEGEIRYDQIKSFLDEDAWFIASQVGLEDIQLSWESDGYQFPTEDDHVYSELNEDDFEPTEDNPTVKITAQELLANFVETQGNWDVTAAVERLGV